MGSRQDAIAAGRNTYLGKRPCKIHGHREKYVHNSWCIDCHREKANEIRRGNKPYNRAVWHRGEHRFKKYGLTADTCRQMYEEQQGICPVCQHHLPWEEINIDHCHEADVVRGLLHRECNLLLGFARDETARLHNAIKYLENANGNAKDQE